MPYELIPEFTVTLTNRQMVLVRVALLQRLDRLKAKEGCSASYEESRAMLASGGVLDWSVLREGALRKVKP